MCRFFFRGCLIEDAKGPGAYKNSPHTAAPSVDSSKFDSVSPAHASVRSNAKYVVTKSSAKNSQVSNSLPTSEPPKETTEKPNAFQKAAQSFSSQVYRGSMDFADAVSKHLLFLR
jgi:hypothetical protein